MIPGRVAWPLALSPLAVGGTVAAAMAIAGDERVLQVGIDLPVVALASGALLTGCATAILLSSDARRRRKTTQAAAVAEATAAGAQQEREQHRHFLARLDHELKNPIMAIRAQAAAAEPDAAWRTVDAQAAKLSALVQDLRKLAELETRPLDLESIDLEALVRESIDAIAPQHPGAAGRFDLIVTRVPWPVPPISGDLDLLSIAVDNVLGNAAKYSATGTIEVRLREENGDAVIEVADNGRGIPADDLPLVFDELARAGNARDVPGSGLGLTLVSTVLRRHGGEVSVRSVAGAGTLVVLRMPLVAAG